jgi:hypothetical protein
MIKVPEETMKALEEANKCKWLKLQKNHMTDKRNDVKKISVPEETQAFNKVSPEENSVMEKTLNGHMS